MFAALTDMGKESAKMRWYSRANRVVHEHLIVSQNTWSQKEANPERHYRGVYWKCDLGAPLAECL